MKQTLLFFLLLMLFIVLLPKIRLERYSNGSTAPFSLSSQFSPSSLPKRKCFHPKMNHIEERCYTKLVKIMAKILKKHQIDWIPVGGSLLAVYRHNKLFIPWDDDYDIAINQKQIKRGLEVLNRELPKYNAKLIYFKKWDKNGHLYKISFLPNHPRYKKVISNFKGYTWPYIDIFVNIENTKDGLTGHDLDSSEYPLETKKISGLTIKVPSKGIRSYGNFKTGSLLTSCIEQEYSHQFERRNPCIGEKKVKCKTLPPSMYPSIMN